MKNKIKSLIRRLEKQNENHGKQLDGIEIEDLWSSIEYDGYDEDVVGEIVSYEYRYGYRIGQLAILDKLKKMVSMEVQ